MNSINRRDFVVAATLGGLAALAGCKIEPYKQDIPKSISNHNELYLTLFKSNNGNLYFQYSSQGEQNMVFRIDYSRIPEGSDLESMIRQSNPNLPNKTVSAISDIAYALASHSDLANLRDGEIKLVRLDLLTNRPKTHPNGTYPIPRLELRAESLAEVIEAPRQY